MKILCVGEATYDINYLIQETVLENAQIDAYAKTECGGGVSSNIAYLLAKWKMESYFVGTIGKDNNGKEILKEFNDVGVKTNFLEINKKVSTISNTIISNKNNFSSTIINYKKDEISTDIEVDITPDIIVVDGTEHELSLKILNQYPKAKSFMSLTKFSKKDIELIKKTDYVVCSIELASYLTNVKVNYKNNHSLIEIYSKLSKAFKNLIISLDNIGYLYEMDGQVKIMPCMKIEKVNTTGSCDIFLGAFIYGIANKFNKEKSLKYANIASSLSTTKLGGRVSIPELSEVEDIYESLK